MTLRKTFILAVFLLVNAGVSAQEFDVTALNKFVACQSSCVDKMDECHATLEPKCKNAKDKTACYEPCNAAYNSCLGECAKLAPNFGAMPKPK